MTIYHSTNLQLSDRQKRKFLRAYDHRCAVTLRLNAMQLAGPDVLMLTARQQNQIHKAINAGTGVELKISKTQMPNAIRTRLLTTRQQDQIRRAIRGGNQDGGSLFSAVVPLARTLAPTLAKTLGLSALAGLASEGASQVAKKISGNGMKGGFLIPQDKIQKLLDNKHLLTKKQKEQILAALQSGGQVVVKPSAKQSGGMLGTILASIGIPLALEMAKKLFGKGAPRVGRPKGKGAPRVGRPKGKGAPRLGAPPPFFGTWGQGMKKKKSKGKGLLLGEKSPFNNIPILGAIL